MTWLIMLLALLLRLPLLNQSLWLDEAIEALAVSGRMGPLLSYALADYQPPLYHFLVAGWTSLAGYSEIALRTPSLLAGLGTVWFLFKIGKHLGGARLAHIVGILAATNPLLIYYSQEGRTYALTTFFVTASMYYFFKILADKANRLTTLSYLLTTIFYLWTSYLAWFVLVAQAGYLLWSKRYRLLYLPVVAALTLVLWLPSLLSSLSIGHSTLATSPEWGRVVGGASLKSVALTWVKFVLGRISFVNRYFYGAVVLAIGLLHALILRQVKFKPHLLLVLWIVIPIILGLTVSLVLPIYSYTRLLFVLPAYLLLLAIGVARISPKLVGLLVVVQLACLAVFWFTPRLHREDWRTLLANLPPQASVAIPSRAQSAPLRYYGYEQAIIEPSRDPLSTSVIYYVRYAEDLFDPNLAGQANLTRSGYTITQQYTYPGLQLDVYENRH